MSADSFASQTNARAAAERFRSGATAYAYRLGGDATGNLRWSAVAPNNQRVALAAEAFASEASAERAAAVARELAAGAAGP